jgi:hypothetical protein
LQEGATFCNWQATNIGGMGASKEVLAAVHRVGAHDRLRHGWGLTLLRFTNQGGVNQPA